MADDDYISVPSTGKLKLKGVADGRVDKKKKKKRPKPEEQSEPGQPQDDFNDKSVVLKSLEEEDEQIQKEARRKMGVVDGQVVGSGAGVANDDERAQLKTDSERKFEEQRRKRLEEKLKREGVKTHKQRVEELNKYLSGLSEHNDMPRIGPG